MIYHILKWMFSQKLVFKSSWLLNGLCVIQVCPPTTCNSDDLCLLFCLLYPSSMQYRFRPFLVKCCIPVWVKIMQYYTVLRIHNTERQSHNVKILPGILFHILYDQTFASCFEFTEI